MGKKTIMGIMLAIITTVLITLGVTSCGRVQSYKDNRSRKDSTWFAKLATKYHNPVYTDASAFVSDALDEAEYVKFTDLISSLDSRTSSVIADRVISKHKSVNWRSFVNEYKAHEDIYLQFDNTLRGISGRTPDIKPEIPDDNSTPPDDSLTSEQEIIQEFQSLYKSKQ